MNEPRPGDSTTAWVATGRWDLSTDMLAVASLDGYLTSVNASWERVLGYSPAELASRSYLDLVHPDDLAATAAEAQALLLPGHVTVSFENRYRCKDGKYRQLVWSARTSDDGHEVFCIVRDVTEDRIRDERVRLMLANVTDVVLDVAPDRTIRWVSPSVQQVLGWEPSQLVGKPNAEFIHPDDRTAVTAARESPPDGKAVYSRVRIRQSDGGYRWMSGVSRELRDADGVLLGRVAGLRDIDDIVRADQALAASHDYFRLLAENGSDVVLRTDRNGVFEWMSPSVKGVLGWDPGDMVGHPAPEFIHSDDHPGRELAIAAINAGERGEYEARWRTAAGGYRWMSVTVGPIFDDNGDMVGRIGSARDIQAEVEARRARDLSEQRFRLAMDSAPVGMAVQDLDSRFLDVNAALCRMLGRDEAWLLSHGFTDVLEVSFGESDLRLRAELVSGRATSSTQEEVLVRADGSTVWVEHSIGLLRDESGLPRSFVCQFVDITDAKQSRARLEARADHDSLTQLLTRSALLVRIARTGAHPPREGTRLAVLFIDIDGFKETNDRHGHLAGDRVLQAVADRVTTCARADDMVARLGGDEIVVALPSVQDAADAEIVASKIQSALAGPILVDGGPIHATVSIGIAVAEPGEDAEHVIARADQALYRAKRAGRARTITYDPNIDTAEPNQPSG